MPAAPRRGTWGTSARRAASSFGNEPFLTVVTWQPGSAGAVVVPGAGRPAGDLVVVPLVGGPLVAVVGDLVAGHVGLVRLPGRRAAVPRGRRRRGRGWRGGRRGRRRGRGRGRRGHRRPLGEGHGVGGEVPRILRHAAALAGGAAVVVRRI